MEMIQRVSLLNRSQPGLLPRFIHDLRVRHAYDKLAEGTIRGTISNFRNNGRLNPTKVDDGQLSFILSRLFRAFRNEDPNEVQQKAVPP
jgi:hypothetical protein